MRTVSLFILNLGVTSHRYRCTVDFLQNSKYMYDVEKCESILDILDII